MHSDCVCLHLALQAVHLLPAETGEGEEGKQSKESQVLGVGYQAGTDSTQVREWA